MHFSGTQQKYQGFFDDLPLPKVPIGVMDVGSNTLKAMVVKPDGTVQEQKLALSLGKSLNQNHDAGKASIAPEAVQELRENVQLANQWLQNQGVSSDRVWRVATEGLRGAGEAGRQLAQELELHILSPQEECEAMRDAILHTIRPYPDRAVAIAVGGGSTEIAFADKSLDLLIPVGTGRLAIPKPFDSESIDALRKSLHTRFSKEIQPTHHAAAAQGPLYVSYQTELGNLANLLKPNHAKEGITADNLDWLLSPKGLVVLNHLLPENRFKSIIPVRLAVYAELMKALGVQKVYLGGDGGMKTALMRYWLHAQTQ